VNIEHIRTCFVDEAHRHELLVIAWPPNTPTEVQTALDHDVDMICSDLPDMVLSVLGRR
jgi:hypothetical protein